MNVSKNARLRITWLAITLIIVFAAALGVLYGCKNGPVATADSEVGDDSAEGSDGGIDTITDVLKGLGDPARLWSLRVGPAWIEFENVFPDYYFPDCYVSEYYYEYFFFARSEPMSCDIEIIEGTLPPGLSIENDHIIGVPTESGVFVFTVHVIGQTEKGETAEDTLEITLTAWASDEAPEHIPSIPPDIDKNGYPAETPIEDFKIQLLPDLLDGYVGYKYFDGFHVAWSWPVALSFELVDGQLPPGLTIKQDGSLRGTPTQAGTYVFSVCITSLDPKAEATTEIVMTIHNPG